MPRPKDTVRKSFMMKEDLEPRLISYGEKTGFSQAQIFNIAIRQFLDGEDMKKFMLNVDPEKFAQEFVKQSLKLKAEEEAKKAPTGAD